jgi:indole-3-glycerol phosphate synthase
MILDEIVRHKVKEVEALKAKEPLEVLRKKVRALGGKKRVFLKALKENGPVAVIAEIKRKSPSKGMLRKNFDPVRLAREFEDAGAGALSVLTDEKFFGGSAEILKKVRAATKLPILRKDFTVDEYQVWQSRLIGADAVLLIASILSQKQLKSFSVLAQKLGLDCLFEVHSPSEAKKVLALKPKLVGINNRDLKTFLVDLATTKKLAKYFSSPTFLVSESGIGNWDDLVFVKRAGARGVLVGESLMKEKSPGQALKKLLGKTK